MELMADIYPNKKTPMPMQRALKKSIFFSFGTVTLLLFSEAFRSLSAVERRVSSYASLRAGSRLSRFPAGLERCFSKQRNVSYYYFNELVDFSFILEELNTKYCLDNGHNAIPPIRMFFLAINDVSDVDLVERSKYDMSSWIWHQKIQ